MAETGPGAAGGYVAFISYSHKDATIGRWLHGRLEGYRLPKRLAGTQGEGGEVPARLTPIFRDRDELPAAGDLSERVRAALAVSRNLIVLCSPNSAASTWVAKEIATFRELHPGRPIFTAIVDGEPDRCFSPALREGGIEPLAADLRKAGDGRRLGLLKLVAGLSGVGLDDLVQRDATRRIRRVSYITVAALAAMLVMALMTTIALTARAEAQVQRAQAEGLVEFMLTDLRDRLHAVGRLDALGAVNARALQYYGRDDDLDRLPDESLSRRARILQAMGDDARAAKDHGKAFAAFGQAMNTTAEQVARSPRDPKRVLEHIKSLSGLGMAHEMVDDWPRASTRYLQASQAADRLVLSSPDNADYLLQAASAAVNVGNVRFSASHDYPAAAAWHSKAAALLDRALRSRPGDPHLLLSQANALGWLADGFYMRGLWPKSVEIRLRQHAIVKQLYDGNPTNTDFAFRLATSKRGTAHSLAKSGARIEARRYLTEARSLTDGLTCWDEENGEWLAFKAKLEKDVLKPEFGFRGLIWAAPRRSPVEATKPDRFGSSAQCRHSFADDRRTVSKPKGGGNERSL
ncbi:MAG TPA: toll/interleukin-1 receptor domain-containing protein [Allosphingosinicella sp.]|jgi:tetratricopeptide (TPR) repeat protein